MTRIAGYERLAIWACVVISLLLLWRHAGDPATVDAASLRYKIVMVPQNEEGTAKLEGIVNTERVEN